MILVLALATLVLGKFPKGFKFGASTAAFQIEGAWLDDDKSPSVWDNLAHLPGYTADGTAPEVGADSYHRYQEDIELMKTAGIKHYRLSLSWPRIVPRGHAGSTLNTKAIDHYKQMFEALKAAGITPYVTLYHWDLPAILQIHGRGLVDPYFVRDFLFYAEACFEHFGEYVKYWFTFNEPWCMSILGEIKEKDLSTMPYLIAHNTLLAHAETVHLYRRKYKEVFNGQIGIVLNSDMAYPKNIGKKEDIEARDRSLLFGLGWFADPVFFGDYPEVMRERVGDRLPKFTEEQKKMLKGSTDFLGLNHYTSSLTEPGNAKEQKDYWSDRNVTTSNKKEWKFTDMGWAIVPEGIHDLIVYIHERYLKGTTTTEILITENGMANKELTVEDAEKDTARIQYLQDYLANVERAITEEKVNVGGYFVWSLLDNFEWKEGFSKRFGVVRVEYTNPPKRIPKGSFKWYANFIKENSN